jgi:NADPH:quinone reductase-like Zn-dependent oxidoreductase
MAIARRDPGPRDIVIDIAFAGICHSDIEHAWSLRGQPIYPLVPGHEIADIVSATGIEVTRSPWRPRPSGQHGRFVPGLFGLLRRSGAVLHRRAHTDLQRDRPRRSADLRQLQPEDRGR